jgi:hypothetical protein
MEGHSIVIRVEWENTVGAVRVGHIYLIIEQ